MDWLTEKQVKEIATTKRGAFEVSIEHWHQGWTASESELREIIREAGKDFTWGYYCGLCKFYRGGHVNPDTGETCPLKEHGGCCETWRCANAAWGDLCDNFSPENLAEWRETSKAMHDKLVVLKFEILNGGEKKEGDGSFSLDVHEYYYAPEKTPWAPFWLAGNSHTWDGARRLHQKLGELIAIAEQKAKLSSKK